MAQASLSTGPGLTFSMQSCGSAVKMAFIDEQKNPAGFNRRGVYGPFQISSHLVAQHRREPALGLPDGHALAPGIVLDLVPSDFPDAEILRLGV
jgi:hypothetical protein